MITKVYVDVVAHFDTDGNLTPTQITWEDGKVYDIGKVTDVRQAASLKAGGCGIRYTCQIGKTQTYLFLEEKRWFVERR